MECSSPYVAEVKALEWATSYAEDAGWKNIYWSLDAKEVVTEIQENLEPCGWDTRFAILAIKKRFKEGS